MVLVFFIKTIYGKHYKNKHITIQIDGKKKSNKSANI